MNSAAILQNVYAHAYNRSKHTHSTVLMTEKGRDNIERRASNYCDIKNMLRCIFSLYHLWLVRIIRIIYVNNINRDISKYILYK